MKKNTSATEKRIKRVIGVSLTAQEWAALKAIASGNHRTLSSQVSWILKRRVRAESWEE